MTGLSADQHDDGELIRNELLELLAPRSGHFRLESGHHGDLWLDLDRVFARPAHLQRLIEPLAERLAAHHQPIDAICGPLIGGAFVAQMVAATLDVAFCYTERVVAASSAGAELVSYRLPRAVQSRVAGQRVAIVDDAINAGSAIRGTLSELRFYGAEAVALGALLVLGHGGADVVADQQLPIERLAHLSSGLWLSDDCPLCAAGRPLNDHV